MKRSTEAAWERAMKIKEVIIAGDRRITSRQAAEIIVINCREMRRWRWRYEQNEYDGCRMGGGAGPQRSGRR